MHLSCIVFYIRPTLSLIHISKGGIFPAIVGTFYLIVGSSIISFPIGIMSGIYMRCV